MQSTLKFGNQILHNPTKKVIASVLRRTPAYYEITLFLTKSRIKPYILHSVEINGIYQTYNGAVLILKYNQIYLTLASHITSIKDINRLETVFENSKHEILLQYPTYQINIKKASAFHKMLGTAWKKK